MQRLVEVKKRMRTIQDIQNVARTMATVSAAKLSRTRARAAGMRLYIERMRAMLERQQRYLSQIEVPLGYVSRYFVARENPRRIMLVHLSGDRGMCGNYNVVINRLALESVAAWQERGLEVEVVTRGSKGQAYLRKRTETANIDHGTWPRAGVTDKLTDRLFEIAVKAFDSGEVDEIWCTYTRFYSPVRREPRLVRMLPIMPQGALAIGDQAEAGPGKMDVVHADLSVSPGTISPAATERWSYEPTFTQIVLPLVQTFARMQFEDVLLESFASEQGARMITMEEATERAGKRLHECRVLYNRLRREYITTDLIGVLFASRMRGAEETRTPETPGHYTPSGLRASRGYSEEVGADV